METQIRQPGGQTYAVQVSRPAAVVIHCSDPRFQRAFGAFLQEELHLEPGTYIPLVISGGIGSLAEPLRLPKEFKFVRDRIALFLDRFQEINRIILINHEDCRHYEALKEFLGKAFLRHAPTLAERQRSDLLRVAETLPGILKPGLIVDRYYARFADPEHTRVTFERL